MAAEEWVSPETELKERDFQGILSMHLQICKGIRARWGGPPYLYADLYAGPGHLQFNGRPFLGSPLIFLELAAKTGIPYEALCYEKDPAVALELSQAVAGLNGARPAICAQPCEVGFKRWLDALGRPQRQQFGLIYSDPIRDEIPRLLLAKAAALLPRVDILTYVSATQYKRRRGANPERPFLSDHVQAIGKKVVLIRRPTTAWHWTFILLSNWVNLPEWRKQGFYRLDSSDGAEIMKQLDLSAREHREAANTPLPFEQPPYRTYAEYLKHPRFLKIRAQVFKRAAGLCERCRKRPPTEPHHLRYPPWGTFDVPENMIAVCHPCHCEIHGKAA